MKSLSLFRGGRTELISSAKDVLAFCVRRSQKRIFNLFAVLLCDSGRLLWLALCRLSTPSKARHWSSSACSRYCSCQKGGCSGGSPIAALGQLRKVFVYFVIACECKWECECMMAHMEETRKLVNKTRGYFVFYVPHRPE